MTERTSYPLESVAIDQKTVLLSAWQAWSKASAEWATQVQCLQSFNFVFRTVWDSETKADWLRQLCRLRQSALRAQNAWEHWQRQLDAYHQTQLYLPTKSSPTSPYNNRGYSPAQRNELHLTWGCLLKELDYAERADEYFLPDDAQWLAVRTHRHCQQLLHASEQVKVGAGL